MDLVDAGVYEKDFELVWANERDDDESSPPNTPKTPNTPDKPKPKSSLRLHTIR